MIGEEDVLQVAKLSVGVNKVEVISVVIEHDIVVVLFEVFGYKLGFLHFFFLGRVQFLRFSTENAAFFLVTIV